MAYSDPSFSFNPSRSDSFDPSSPKKITNESSPIGVKDSVYVPICSNQNNLVKQTYTRQVNEYNNRVGMPIMYQPVKYKFNTHNFIYGEDPTSGFHYARPMKAVISFSSYASFATKWGIMSDADMIIYIPIAHFEQIWGPTQGEIFPLAGDIFYITDEACDRPLGQTPMIWQVTDKEDRLNPVDFMGGHYIWKLTCKRFDYSYEPNAPEERFLDDEAGDTKVFGRLAGGENPADLSIKEYDVDDFAKKEFDNRKTNVYGEYVE